MPSAERSASAEPARLVDETVVAVCFEPCGWETDDEDLALILAVGHWQATNHRVTVVTTRTEILEGS